MSLLNSLGKFFGINKQHLLTDCETHLLNQLQTNRRTVSQQLIPDRMKNKFISSVYPDQQLMFFVKGICSNESVSEETRRKFLQNAIRLSLSIEGFGTNLISHYRLNPEAVVTIMLQDIDFE